MAHGLCASHARTAARQRARGEAVRLRPIRERGRGRIRVFARVTPGTHAALGPEPGRRLGELAEAWARRRAAR